MRYCFCLWRLLRSTALSMGIVCVILSSCLISQPTPLFARSNSTRPVLDSLETVWGVYKTRGWVDTSVVRLLNRLADEYIASNPKRAREYAAEAKQMAERIGDMYGQARALKNIGTAYTQQSFYDNAIEYHFQALKLYETLNDKKNIADMLSQIGVTTSRRGDWQNAIAYYQKAEALYRELNNPTGLSNLYVNFGSTYSRSTQSQQKDYARAIEYFRKAIAIQSVERDTRGLGVSFSGIANVYSVQEQYDSASQYYFRSLPYLEQSNDKKNLADCYNNLAGILAATGRYKETMLYVEKGLQIANEFGLRETRQGLYYILYDIYEQQGDHRRAFEYSRMYNDLADSIYNEKAERITAETSEKYQTEKKDAEIRELNRKQEQQAEQQRNLLIGLGLVVTIVLLLGYAYTIKQRSETELQKKNLQLEEANKEISRQNTHLEELNSEKNEFMGIVAHDLKNPILSIKLLAQLLHDHGMLSDEERTRFTTTIISSSDQMARIINNLLDVNAIERGGMTLDLTTIDLSVAAYTVYEEYETIANNKNVKLHFDSESDAECLADQTAMIQVLDNLVSNAVKYSPSGKNVWVRVLANRPWEHSSNGQLNGFLLANGQNGDKYAPHPHHAEKTLPPYCIRIEIQDEGPGLSDDDKKKLFGKFVRLSAQPTAGERSTGLGLSIVKKMVTAMHGHVWCESELGKGAMFVVELPQVLTPAIETDARQFS